MFSAPMRAEARISVGMIFGNEATTIRSGRNFSTSVRPMCGTSKRASGSSERPNVLRNNFRRPAGGRGTTMAAR